MTGKIARQKLTTFYSCAAGATAMAFGLMAPFVMSAIGFGAEVTIWELRGRQLQGSLDIAAYASATQLRSGKGSAAMTDASSAILNKAGFESANTTLSIQSPPATGSYSGDSSAVRVAVTYNIPRTFTRLVADDDHVTVTRHATARVFEGRPACLIALHRTASGAVTFSGSSDVTLQGCDVASNSISSSAISVGGSATVVTECASAVGHIVNDGGMSYTDCAKPIEEAPVTSDPFAAIADPTVPAGCTVNDEWTTSSTGAPTPGMKYCGGANIKGDLTLGAGTYYLSGGTWKFTSQASVSGSDVMIYLTNGAEIDINGGADVVLSAPSSGDYAGILIFGDRNDTEAYKLNGGSNMLLTGAVYSPTSTVEFTGNNNTGGTCVQLVASQITLSGNSTFSSSCSIATGTDALVTAQKVLLVE